MKVKLYMAAVIFFLIETLFLSQAFAEGEYYFNPAGDKQYIVEGTPFEAEFTYLGSTNKLIKEVQLGAKLSAYYDEAIGGLIADFKIRITINGKAIIWTLDDYEAPTSTPEPDLYDSSLITVSDEIIISPDDTIYLKIEIVSRQGQGIIYKETMLENNYLKLILDDPPVTCDVVPNFVLYHEKDIVLIGELITFENTSTGDGVEDYNLEGEKWEWSFNDDAPIIFPEDKKYEKFPEYTFKEGEEGTYTLTLVSTGKQGDDECKLDFSRTFEVKCGVQANFTPSAYTISKGESITFTNTSTGNSVTDENTTWEWSFIMNPENIIFPENENDKENPEITFNTVGLYRIQLKATASDLCSTLYDQAIIKVADTNLSHAIMGLKILAGVDETLSDTDKKLTDLVKDDKITLEDVISILKKIAEQ